MKDIRKYFNESTYCNLCDRKSEVISTQLLNTHVKSKKQLIFDTDVLMDYTTY